MKSSRALLALLVGIVLGGIWHVCARPARAADGAAHGVGSAISAMPRGEALPFARSERSQSVWAADVCWNGCQSYCTWGEAGCLKVDAQGQCLAFTDHCDRVCQRECRSRGGPLVPDIFDF